MLSALTALALPAPAQTIAPVTLMTAGDGSAFLPYGQGIAAYLASKGITIEVRKSAGSNENLSAADASATVIGTAFMGSAYDAVNGTGWAAGRKHENLRALFPMYETSFQIAALRRSTIKSLADLDGKKVGVGPAKGPAEVFFQAAAEVAHIKPVIVNGDPAALVKTCDLAGEIDALWQGAVTPIPSLSDRRRSGRYRYIRAQRCRDRRHAAEVPAALGNRRFRREPTRAREAKSAAFRRGIS